MNETRVAQIEQAITTLEARGEPWGNRQVFTLVKGSYVEMARYLKERRAAANSDGHAAAVTTTPAPPRLAVSITPTAPPAQRDRAATRQHL